LGTINPGLDVATTCVSRADRGVYENNRERHGEVGRPPGRPLGFPLEPLSLAWVRQIRLAAVFVLVPIKRHASCLAGSSGFVGDRQEGFIVVPGRSAASDEYFIYCRGVQVDG